MNFDGWDRELLAKVRETIPRVEGTSCVNLDAQDGSVFVCRRVRDLLVHEHSIEGMCE